MAYKFNIFTGNFDNAGSGGGDGVLSFNGRTGVVVSDTNDYTWAQINKTTSSIADITTRSAGDLSSGTLLDARLSSNVPLKNASNAFTIGNQTITNSALSQVPLTLKGAASQSANLFEIRNSSDNIRVSVTSVGTLRALGGFEIDENLSGFDTDRFIVPTYATRMTWSSGSTMPGWSLVGNNGSTDYLTMFMITPNKPTSRALILKGSGSGQTANLQEFRNTADTVLLSIRASGEIATDNVTDAGSNQIVITTGTSSGTGNASGDVVVCSGSTTDDANSGGLYFFTEIADNNSGNIDIYSSDAGNNSGDIWIGTGTAGGTRGQINFYGPKVDFDVDRISVPTTVTGGGTTGNQTINKVSGTVNFAASASTLTVTNSFVATTSIVFAVVRTNDTTATIKNVVPANGSFVITLAAAATAETSVGFFVLNG